MAHIYKWTNKKNRKVYIGSTNRNPQVRKQEHISRLRRNEHHSRHFQRAFNLDSEDSFEFEIIEECNTDQAETREQYWIDNYQSNNPDFGYNLRKVSDSNIGYKHPNDSIENHKRAKILYFQDQNNRQNISNKSKKMWEDPQMRNKIIERIRNTNGSSEERLKISDRKSTVYVIIESPDGKCYKTRNTQKFCIEFDLNPGRMSEVLNNKKISHKGWTIRHMTPGEKEKYTDFLKDNTYILD